jgi:hypothetical protein
MIAQNSVPASRSKISDLTAPGHNADRDDGDDRAGDREHDIRKHDIGVRGAPALRELHEERAKGLAGHAEQGPSYVSRHLLHLSSDDFAERQQSSDGEETQFGRFRAADRRCSLRCLRRASSEIRCAFAPAARLPRRRHSLGCCGTRHRALAGREPLLAAGGVVLGLYRRLRRLPGRSRDWRKPRAGVARARTRRRK